MTNRIHDRAVSLLEVSRSGLVRPAQSFAGVYDVAGGNGSSLEEEQMELLDAIAASMQDTNGTQAQGVAPRIRQAAITDLLEQLCVLPQLDRLNGRQDEAFSSWMRNNRLAPSLRT